MNATVTILSIWSKRNPTDEPVSYEVIVPRGETAGETLEAAFNLTNQDTRPHRTRVCATSTGDLMVLDNQPYFCDNFGFTPVSAKQFAAIQKLSSRDTGFGLESLIESGLIPVLEAV